MQNHHDYILLHDDEPPPVSVERANGASPVFLACDHASRRLPRRLGDLGLAAPELSRHIAWDIGVEAVARSLSENLDATLVRQAYSRLVIDCNRSPQVESSIPLISETTDIPGNRDLSAAQIEARRREIFQPYHDAIAERLEARGGRTTLLIAIHSFTPVFKGQARPWHIGLLYNRDDRLARLANRLLAEDRTLVIGDNKPYFVSDQSDYTIPVHGERRGIPHLLIEIRQDLLMTAAGQREWAERLTALCRRMTA